MTPSPAAARQDQEVLDRHTSTLTKRELAAIHRLLQTEFRLLGATSASEMLVTYPSPDRVKKLPSGKSTPEAS